MTDKGKGTCLFAGSSKISYEKEPQDGAGKKGKKKAFKESFKNEGDTRIRVVKCTNPFGHYLTVLTYF